MSCALVGNSTPQRRINILTSLLALVRLNGLYEFDVSEPKKQTPDILP